MIHYRTLLFGFFVIAIILSGIGVFPEDIFLLLFVGLFIYIGALLSKRFSLFPLKSARSEIVAGNYLQENEPLSISTTQDCFKHPTPQKDEATQLAYALYDDLTMLPNRMFFLHYLGGVLSNVEETIPHCCLSMLLLDCDHFRTVNDSLGHPIGDQLLIAVAERILSCLDEHEMLARLGGDEFAILVQEHEQQQKGAFTLANCILASLTKPFVLDKQEVFMTASIGIVIQAETYKNPDDVLRDADTALHQAKALGRGRYAAFDSDMYAQVVKRLEMSNELRRAIERNELLVYYQPIVSLNNGAIIGFEALVRWQHPQRGLLSPGEFLPIANEIGLSSIIDRWVLRQACTQLKQWQTDLASDIPLVISVNVNGHDLTEPDFAQKVNSVVQETGISPQSLKLEITEETVIDKPEIAIVTLHDLHAIGIKVSLDDFGTGYSSLSYLHRLPINTLKIDRSFVSGVEIDNHITEVVRTIVTLAHNLGMDVIAEGAETTAHLDLLNMLGCEYGQGYYFSQPVAAKEAEILLKTSRQSSMVAFNPLPLHAEPQNPPLTISLINNINERIDMEHEHAIQAHTVSPTIVVTTVPAESLNRHTSPSMPPLITDPLTGLPNRDSVVYHIQQAITCSTISEQSFAVAFLDIDHFTSINDAFGHTRGDEVLVTFANRVLATIRSSDHIFRYGNDEFVLVLPHTNKEQSLAFTKRLLENIHATPFVGIPPLNISISIGIALYPDDARTPEDIVAVAEQRNYHAKHHNRGCTETLF